jgi:hypothetical protein
MKDKSTEQAYPRRCRPAQKKVWLPHIRTFGEKDCSGLMHKNLRSRLLDGALNVGIMQMIPPLCVNNSFHSEPKLLSSRLWRANPTHQTMKTFANQAIPGDEQIGSITCQPKKLS